jgi:hypothetical protein
VRLDDTSGRSPASTRAARTFRTSRRQRARRSRLPSERRRSQTDGGRPTMSQKSLNLMPCASDIVGDAVAGERPKNSPAVPSNPNSRLAAYEARLEREYLQADGRVRRWARIKEMEGRYLLSCCQTGRSCIMHSSAEDTNHESSVLRGYRHFVHRVSRPRYCPQRILMTTRFWTLMPMAMYAQSPLSMRAIVPSAFGG